MAADTVLATVIEATGFDGCLAPTAHAPAPRDRRCKVERFEDDVRRAVSIRRLRLVPDVAVQRQQPLEHLALFGAGLPGIIAVTITTSHSLR